MARMYRTLPYQGGEPRAVAEVTNNAMNGKTNNTGRVPLPHWYLILLGTTMGT